MGRRECLRGRRGRGRCGRCRSRYRGSGSRGVDGLGDGPKEGGDLGDELGGATELGYTVDDGASDDDSIGEGGDLSGLGRVRDSEANADGEGSRFFEEGDFFTEGGGKVLLHSGDALAGDVVDEA